MKKKLSLALAIVLASLLCTVYLLFVHETPGSTFLKSVCKGSARCFYGTIERITDGDTLEINGDTVRLALINSPEKWEPAYEDAKSFVETICPIGSDVVVDEDDLQVSRSHRRIVAVVYCGNNKLRNLNEELLNAGYAKILEDFCERSEFADERWAKSYGCD